MRILFLTQVLPYPLNAGPKVRAHYVLRHLAERGHEVTLVSFRRGDDSEGYIRHVEDYCRAVYTVPMCRSRAGDAWHLARSLLTGRSFIITRDSHRAMRHLVERLLSQQHFDVVHSDQLWMAQYALQCMGVKRVLDAHNAVYLIPQRLAQHERNPLKRWALEREWKALARFEGDVCGRFDHVVTVTEEDRVLLTALSARERASSACSELDDTGDEESPPLLHRDASRSSGAAEADHITVIPICVDPEEKRLVQLRPTPRRVVILGTMFWPPNVEGTVWFGRGCFRSC